MKRIIVTTFLVTLLISSCNNRQSITDTEPLTSNSTTRPRELTASEPTQSPTQVVLPENTPDDNPPVGTSHDVIIDTDMAVDDWMAILYLLVHEDINVRAITVTGTGEAHCEAGVRNALGLVKLAQHIPIPVASGPEEPLTGNHVFPQDWRDYVDDLAGQTLSPSVNPAEGMDAVQLLTQTLLASPEKISLLTLGPLTNIALAFQAEPRLANQIAEIVVMGGAVQVAGNMEGFIPGNTSAEWNIYIDPQAANVVFGSGVPITLVGLDATNQVPLTMDFYKRLKANQDTDAIKFIIAVMMQMLDRIQSGAYYFWDPLSAAILVDKSLAAFQQFQICVVETESTESGKTEVKDGCPQLNVAVSVDAARFEEDFLDTLNQ